MAKKKSTNVTKLAKNSSKTNTNKKTTEKKQESTNIDVKAKERVNKLLDDVNLTPKKGEGDNNLLELNEKNVQSLEWLQEQIDKLSTENEKLKKEADEAKENYKKLYADYQANNNGKANNNKDNLVPDSMLKNGVIDLFTEFQKNFLGQNPQKIRYSEIKLPHLMNKMIKKFPFLKEMKRF
jgi:hypothetical protein